MKFITLEVKCITTIAKMMGEKNKSNFLILGIKYIILFEGRL